MDDLGNVGNVPECCLLVSMTGMTETNLKSLRRVYWNLNLVQCSVWSEHNAKVMRCCQSPEGMQAFTLFRVRGQACSTPFIYFVGNDSLSFYQDLVTRFLNSR